MNKDFTSQLDKIAELFNLGEIIVASEQIDSITNINYLVTTDKGQFVVKFLVSETAASVINSVVIREKLKTVEIPTSEFVSSKFDLYTEIVDGNEVCVSKRILGQVIEPTTQSFCHECGTLLAKFHNTIDVLTEPAEGWMNPIPTQTPEQNPELSAKALAFIDENSDIYSENLPKGIIHGDFHEGNILVDTNDKIVALLDFDETEENLLLVDIVRTILDLADPDEKSAINMKFAKALLNGYQKVRKLTKAEKDYAPRAMKYAAGKCALWMLARNFEDEALRYLTIAEKYSGKLPL